MVDECKLWRIFHEKEWALKTSWREFLRGMGAAVGLALSVQVAPAAERPSVVIFFADDLGYADVGYHGSPDIVTPHIDSIAERGVQFTAGYVTAPVCGPSRAGTCGSGTGTIRW